MVPFYSLRFLWLPPPPPILYSFVVSRLEEVVDTGNLGEWQRKLHLRISRPRKDLISVLIFFAPYF